MRETDISVIIYIAGSPVNLKETINSVLEQKNNSELEVEIVTAESSDMLSSLQENGEFPEIKEIKNLGVNGTPSRAAGGSNIKQQLEVQI